jgi:DNA-binding beta-propeller fold protein YncE
VSIIDLKASPPRVIGEVQAPVSVVGPPLSIAVTPDEGLALVTASNKVDPSDPSRQTPDNRVLGATAEGLKIAPDSSVVAVVVHNGSNRAKDSPFYNDAGKLVVVRVTGKTLSRVAEAPIGRRSQGVAFTPDGRTLLVGNMIEKDYWVFRWDGSALKDTGQRVKVNGSPVAIRTAEK